MAKKKTATKKAAPKKASAAKRATKKSMAHRADYGAPIEGFFAKQPPHLRAILEELRAIVEELVPDASSSIKWGMPFYSVNDETMCAFGAHKSHVNLILSGPPEAYADPDGLLSGTGKTGRHLKLTSVDELPRAAVRGWVRTAVQLALAK